MRANIPKVIDLFAGVGGLSLGALRAGFELSLAVEIDQHAVAAHSLNFPGSKHSAVDISLLKGKQLLELAGLAKGDLDGLIGGPPCQGFSIMGQRDVDDPRNNLFTKFFELVADCQPAFFVAENVPGILDERYRTVRESAFDFVEGKYTLLAPMKLKASDFGAPTIRERVFFIGYLPNAFGNLSIEDFAKARVDTPVTVGEALEGLPSNILSTWLTEEESWRPVQSLSDSDYARRVQSQIPVGVGNAEALSRYREQRLVSGCFGTRHSPEVEARYAELAPGKKDPISKAVRLKLDGLCPTLRAGTGPERGSYQAVRPIHPTESRVITPREAARLQGFPDWFQFAPSKWHSFRQIGNSVSPILAEAILAIIFTRFYSTSGK